VASIANGQATELALRSSPAFMSVLEPSRPQPSGAESLSMRAGAVRLDGDQHASAAAPRGGLALGSAHRPGRAGAPGTASRPLAHDTVSARMTLLSVLEAMEEAEDWTGITGIAPQAIAAADEALASHDGVLAVRIYSILGLGCRKHGSTAKAVAMLKRGLHKAANVFGPESYLHLSLYQNLAECYYDLGHITKALSMYEDAETMALRQELAVDAKVREAWAEQGGLKLGALIRDGRAKCDFRLDEGAAQASDIPSEQIQEHIYTQSHTHTVIQKYARTHIASVIRSLLPVEATSARANLAGIAKLAHWYATQLEAGVYANEQTLETHLTGIPGCFHCHNIRHGVEAYAGYADWQDKHEQLCDRDLQLEQYQAPNVSDLR